MSNSFIKFCGRKIFSTRHNNGFSLRLVFCPFCVKRSHLILNTECSFTLITTQFVYSKAKFLFYTPSKFEICT